MGLPLNLSDLNFSVEIFNQRTSFAEFGIEAKGQLVTIGTSFRYKRLHLKERLKNRHTVY